MFMKTIQKQFSERCEHMSRKKVAISLVLSFLLSIALITTAFATYYGWWNNSLTIYGDNRWTTKGGYSMPSTTGGFLGHFTSNLGADGSFHASMFWRNSAGTQIIEGLWNYTDCSTNTWIEKTSSITSGKTYYYQFTAYGSGEKVTSSDAGYFYDN
jgi:hypothetical protein